MSSYQVTENLELFRELFKITPEVGALLLDLHDALMDSQPFILRELEKAIEQHPDIPQFRNYLYIYYIREDMMEKAKKVNAEMLVLFPGYFVAKMNKASEYFADLEAELIPALVGENFDLGELCPNRNTFLEVEELQMQRVAIFYYVYYGDFDQAAKHLDRMASFDNTSEIFNAAESYFSERLREALEAEIGQKPNLWKHEAGTPAPRLVEYTKPQFSLERIHDLYHLNMEDFISRIDVFTALPNTELRADLERVIDDSIRRFHFFRYGDNLASNDMERNLPPFFSTSFLCRAVWLIAEIGAVELLPKVLEVLGDSIDLNEFYFGVETQSTLWPAVFKLGESQPELLKNFAIDLSAAPFNRIFIAETIGQIALRQPDRKKEVHELFKEILDYYLTAAESGDENDELMVAILVSNAIEIGAENTLPVIEELYNEGYIETSINGDFEQVRDELMGNVDYEQDQSKLPTMKEHFTNFFETGSFEGVTDSMDDWKMDDCSNFDDVEEPMNLNEPIVKEKKIGRNDPCPCGSGKKYKKCCLS